MSHVEVRRYSQILVVLVWFWGLCGTCVSYAQAPASGASWKFAISGDSRNCGDIVMPAIAKGVLNDGAEFYWHLGDYRAIYMVDEDYARKHPGTAITDYQNNAWPDFIQHQLNPFGKLPVYLAIGNHEVIQPKTHDAIITQFADWYDSPVIRQQRLADDPNDRLVKTYYHWVDRGIDFITLDNAATTQFEDDQVAWLKAELKRVEDNPAVKTIVIGMHAAFPDSISAGHSMNDSQQLQFTGRNLYNQLVELRRTTHKNVYVMASHSHYVMDNIYATACHTQDNVLPGWIVGSGGAVRYRLPKDLGQSTIHSTDVYGYVLATVAPDYTISFEFKPVSEKDVPKPTREEFGAAQVRWCFEQNKQQDKPIEGAKCPINCCTK